MIFVSSAFFFTCFSPNEDDTMATIGDATNKLLKVEKEEGE